MMVYSFFNCFAGVFFDFFTDGSIVTLLVALVVVGMITQLCKR